MSKTKVICFANNKGGSGKSTTCSNVGYALSSLGNKVLLIDGDMQLNLTLSFFGEDQALEFAQSGNNLYNAVKNQKDLTDYIVATEYEMKFSYDASLGDEFGAKLFSNIIKEYDEFLHVESKNS